jgi:DNA-binding NtrC family response regulator
MRENMYRLMVVDDEADICNALQFLLSHEGYSVDIAGSGEEALKRVEKTSYSLVLTDIKMEGMSGVELLERLKSMDQNLPVVVMTAYASVEGAVEAMKKGASDYIVKPFINEEVKLTVRRLLEHRKLELENQALKRQLSNRMEETKFVGDSPGIKELFLMMEKIAPTKSNVLLLGESGTGKSMVAELLHNNSPRRDMPFMAINCSAIPETLLESELFGYKKGAFTGANADKQGLIEATDGGTLFLDEIGDMPLLLQSKLLKVIETGEVIPVGSTKHLNVDIRLIAATNKNLENAVKEGSFREDLYYRLDVIQLQIPPLRERKEDIPLLVNSFLGKAADRHGKGVSSMEQEAMNVIMNYSWPGNVRELSNVIERCVVLNSGGHIHISDLPVKLLGNSNVHGTTLKESIEMHERAMVAVRLKEFEGNKEEAARSLGIDLATLYRKIKKYEIEEGKGTGPSSLPLNE